MQSNHGCVFKDKQRRISSIIGNFVQYVNFLELIYGSGISNYITSVEQYCGGQKNTDPHESMDYCNGYLLNNFTDSYWIYTYVYHYSLFKG